MTDRPIAAILAAVAAAMFLAAFSAAAVLRPDSTAVAQDATPPSSPSATTQELSLATIAAPSLSRVVALPALHLPTPPKHHAKKHKAKKVAVKAKVHVAVAPAATPVATPRPTYVAPKSSYVAPKRKASKTFDTSG